MENINGDMKDKKSIVRTSHVYSSFSDEKSRTHLIPKENHTSLIRSKRTRNSIFRFAPGTMHQNDSAHAVFSSVFDKHSR